MRARALGVAPGDLPPGPLQRDHRRRRRARRPGDGRRGRLGAHRRHRHPAARGQPLPRARAGGDPRRQRLRQARRRDAGARARRARDADPAHLHAVRVARRRRAGRPSCSRSRAWSASRSINPVVGETNDGALNAIRSRPDHAATSCARARRRPRAAPVAEGSVGAGAGTVAFGWKGGIGTSSRVLPRSLGGCTVGVLVQTNFGGVLQVLGAPVGRELGRYAFKNDVERERGDGSIMIVVATDAPLDDRNLERLAARAIMGLARTGVGGRTARATTSSPSRPRAGAAPVALAAADADAGAPRPARDAGARERRHVAAVPGRRRGDGGGDLQLAVHGDAGHGRGRTVAAIPLDRVREVLRKYGIAPRR